MAPDVSRPLAQSWGVLSAALVITVIGLWWWWDPALAEQAAQVKQPGDDTGEDLARRIALQETAIKQTAHSTELLKSATGFTVRKDFQILTSSPNLKEREPNARWFDRYNAVKSAIQDLARQRSTAVTPSLGFNLSEGSLPKPEDLVQSLVMLQLVEKAMLTALAPGEPLDSVEISLGALNGRLTGNAQRPPLLREFRLTLKVKGRLENLLGLLHQFAESRNEQDYPLVLCSASIDSNNRTAKDDMPILIGQFELAGMRYLTAEERGVKPLSLSGGGGAGEDGGRRFFARP